MPHPLFEKHGELLKQACGAIQTRTHWMPYASNLSAYGEDAEEAGHEEFSAYLAAKFYLDQPGVMERAGEEVSPYGLPLEISYPCCSPDVLVNVAAAAMLPWMRSGIEARVGACLEILSRLNARSTEIAHALKHTTGQSFAMSFVSGGPQAQARALEALAWAYTEMTQVPPESAWQRNTNQKTEKRFTIAPHGVSLVFGSATQPTWNAYPAIFASLATGNPVIVKPHPTAILPLAITVAVAREVLREYGLNRDVISLLVGDQHGPMSRDVALRPEVRLIDYSGTPDFGRWLADTVVHARLFLEYGGSNCVVIDSSDDYHAMLKNLVLSICLDSGQLRSTPRVIFVNGEGVQTPKEVISAEQFGLDLAYALSRFIENPTRAVDVLGAIQSPATEARIDAVRKLAQANGEILRDSVQLPDAQWPKARIRSPLLIRARPEHAELYRTERFGPIAAVVTTENTAEALRLAEAMMREQGALNFLVHTKREHVSEQAENVALRSGVALSLNLTGSTLVNQTASFSDVFVSGANPAANCGMIDAAFVANRFHIAQVQRHCQSPAEAANATTA